ITTTYPGVSPSELVIPARYPSRSWRHISHRLPNRWARKAPAAMRRRTVDADTPRYSAASRTENSGLGNNSMGLLVVVRDVDIGPALSATSVAVLATPSATCATCATCATSAAPVRRAGEQKAEPDAGPCRP